MLASGIKKLQFLVRIQQQHYNVGRAANNPSWFKAFSTEPNVSSSPLDQFRDAVSREKRFTELVGRSWSVKELRRKSFDDLHKLWLVLYKEKNMLLTESNICRQNSVYFPQKERQQKVKKSMAAIRTVLGERKRDKIAQSALKAMEESEIETAV